jgi:uncharacterized RDD family membrane protein YckC
MDLPLNPHDSRTAHAVPPAGLRYRCCCGKEILVTETTRACPDCGQAVPQTLANDPTLTLSFCSVSLADTGGSPSGEAVAGASPALRSQLAARTGQRLGHFVLQEPLGEGGMGAVYRALDTSLQRYVAVKVLRSGSSAENGTPNLRLANRLRCEAVSQARLNHPRVVTIYYVGREGEEPFLAMELLPGPNLQQRLSQGPLPYAELIEYAIQMTDALDAADSVGMVHGDIKPSNLLMAAPGCIKLGDFGLARRSGSESDDGEISGTPYYLAPEMLDGAVPDRRTDMYALGVTLFEMAFGRRPYEMSGSTLREQLLAHRTAEVQFPQRWPAEIPEAFRDVLSRLLEKDPSRRFASYRELRADLERVRPIGSTPAGRLARTIAWFVDIACLGMLLVPFSLPSAALTFGAAVDAQQQFDERVPYVSYSVLEWVFGFLAVAGAILVPLLALWWDLKRFRTPGRYLMQLRVVDRYGLPPTRRALIIRNVFRYFQLWCSALFGVPTVAGFVVAAIIDDVLGYLVLVVNAIPVLGPTRRALHDRICDTHVVLDERSSRGEFKPFPSATKGR